MNCGSQRRNRGPSLEAFGSASARASKPTGRGWRGGALLWSLALLVGILSSPRPLASQASDEKEIATEDVQAPFRLQVQRNMVLVRAIVRDSSGRPVCGLRKEDFRLFDNGKPQEIDQFAVESSGRTSTAALPSATNQQGEEATSEGGAARAAAQYFQALYFDDVQMTYEDIVRARVAADRYVAATLTPDGRVGIFTSSGQDNLDFTDNRSKLHETLFKLRPRPFFPTDSNACPNIGDYQAYLIVEQRDYIATAVAQQEASQCQCQGLEGNALEACVADAVMGGATRVLNGRQTQFANVLRGLELVVRRASALPGQRSVIFLSPGFLSFNLEFQIAEITERALRANVVVNTLDPRGLYVIIPGGDASRPSEVIPKDAGLAGRKLQIIEDGFARAEDVLSNVAADTGGQFFHNSNDLNKGFRQVGTFSEVSYVLAFSPRNLKFDGQFHKLKLTLANPTAGFTLQARRGYFAPKASEDASTRAKEEIERAIYSRDELRDFPMDVHTQFYKLNESAARLAVLTHLGMSSFRFRKERDRNLNDLSLITILFDKDGNYVTGKEKHLKFQLHDVTLARVTQTGITVKTEFDLKPGTYILRQVVRESEAGQISGLSRTVEIPD